MMNDVDDLGFYLVYDLAFMIADNFKTFFIKISLKLLECCRIGGKSENKFSEFDRLNLQSQPFRFLLNGPDAARANHVLDVYREFLCHGTKVIKVTSKV